MASNQQQVVVMAPLGQTNNIQQDGGEFNGTNQQTTVVIQQPVTEQKCNRFSRWPYLIFGIGMAVYNFLYLIFWIVMIFAANHDPCDAWNANPNCVNNNPLKGYGALFFFCGVVPSIIGFIWMINDSTVFCANPGLNDIKKICCCECINGWFMAIPMAIAALLRFILWCAFFGIAVDALNELEGGNTVIDNLFWMIVSIGSIDVGPFILCAIDWWLYYGKLDYNGLFGHKLQPLRCVSGESIIVMICSWSLVAFFEEHADDVAEYIWPWIVHGIISTLILIFAVFLQFSGSIQGAFVNNIMFKFVCWGLAIAQAAIILIVWVYLFSEIFSLPIISTLILFIYGLYYSGLTIPIVWCLLSIKVNEQKNNPNPAIPAV